MTLPRVWAAVRWALAAWIVGYGGWRLYLAWGGLDAPDLTLRPGPLAGSALAGAAGMVTLALISAAGARAAGLGTGTRAFCIGWLRVWTGAYFYRYVPGKVVLVVERVRLGARLGVPAAASVMLVVWESLLLVSGAALVGGVGLLLLPRTGDQPLSGSAVVGLAVAALLGSLALWPALRWAASRVPALRERLPGLVLEVPPLAQVGLVLGNALAWAFLGASFTCCARALARTEVPDAVLVTWFVASYVGGQVASVTPAGLGIREGLLVAGLAGVVPAPVALAWAVGHRILLSVVGVLVVVGSGALSRLPPATTSPE